MLTIQRIHFIERYFAHATYSTYVHTIWNAPFHLREKKREKPTPPPSVFNTRDPSPISQIPFSFSITLLMLHTPIWISSPTLSPPDTRPSTRCTTPLEIPPPQKLRSNTLTQSQRLHHIPNKPVVDENRHERSFVTSFCNVNNDTSDPLATPIQSRSNREHTRLSYKAWTREQGLLVCCYSYSKTLVWEEGELKG